MTATMTPRVPMDSSDYLSVKNNEDKTLVLTYDSRKYVIEPGDTRPIPFPCAAVYFGDPRAGDKVSALRDSVGRVSFIADRPTEVRRLRTLYDNQLGSETEVTGYPDVTVTDYDGNVVQMVIHDPAGDSVMPANVTVDENDLLRETVRRQQQTIDILAQRLGVDPKTGRDVPASEPVDTEAESNEPLPEDE